MDEREQEAAARKIAREGDPDRYAAALFAPREARANLFALYALNVELARIGEKVSEPPLGEIRLQWWRDSLDRAAGGESTDHPVADAFGRAMRQCGLSPEAVAGLIDARRFDMSVKIMPDTAGLETYLDHTAAALFLLAAEIMCAPARSAIELPALEPAALESAARAAGIAYGLTGLMRALPVHAARGRIDLPADALLCHGVTQAQILAGTTSDGLADLLAELRRRARAALGQALDHLATLTPRQRTAFLPLALVAPYLAAMETGDPLRRIAEINPLHRLWRLATYRFRN
ncbi:MAG: squalene/phytoene synthase family protein [Methyloceanibacter sp.]